MDKLVAVIADTHLPRGTRRLPERCIELIAAADAVIHAGDFVTRAVFDEIAARGPPLHAVHGNVDEPALRRRLPVELVVEIGGAAFGVVHDAGPASGRLERLRLRFPDVACVIFGHTHVPERRRSGAFQIFNPGSPTERRRAPYRAMGLIRIEQGSVNARHFRFADRAGGGTT